jgi:hypothetical protein
MKIAHYLSFLPLLSLPTVFAAPVTEESFSTDAGGYSLSALVGQGPAVLGFTGQWLPALRPDRPM